MTAATQHCLKGLEPDNLLAFLALLGLLRALETASLHPRAHWAGLPLRPVLSLTTPTTQQEIAEAAAKGCAELAKDHDFDGEKDLTFDKVRARELLEMAARPDATRRAKVLDCLFSDAAVNRKGRISPSPLCIMFGQGHQHFLTRLAEVPRGVLPKALAGRRPEPDLNAPDKLVAALFVPWERIDETDSFRWDPAEDRRYALRFRDPSSDPGRTVHGANRLAAVGLPVMPGAAVMRGAGIRFLTLGAEVARDGSLGITWPIWDRPTSLAGAQALLGHPALVAEEADAMRHLGVLERRRAVRIRNRKFTNFTRGEVV